MRKYKYCLTMSYIIEINKKSYVIYFKLVFIPYPLIYRICTYLISTYFLFNCYGYHFKKCSSNSVCLSSNNRSLIIRYYVVINKIIIYFKYYIIYLFIYLTLVVKLLDSLYIYYVIITII